MTPTAMHDTMLPYDVEGALDPRWTDLMFDSLSTGAIKMVIDVRDDVETVVLTGPCPRCGGMIRFSQVLTAANTDTAAMRPGGQSAVTTSNGAAGTTKTRTFVAYCTCGGPHEGSPTTGGCGAAFRIEVEAV